MDNFFTIAAMAPQEIPDWFKHEPAPDKPQKPSFKDDIPFTIRFAIDEWLKGYRPRPTEEDFKKDIPNQYLPPFIDYEEQLAKWGIIDQEARYFQWRIYYAKQLYFYGGDENKALDPLLKIENAQEIKNMEAVQGLINSAKYALDNLFKAKMGISLFTGTSKELELIDQAATVLQNAILEIHLYERRP